MSDIEEYDVEYAERTGMVKESDQVTIPEGTALDSLAPHIHDVDVASYYPVHTATRQYVDRNYIPNQESVDIFDEMILEGIKRNIDHIQHRIGDRNNYNNDNRGYILEMIREFLDYCQHSGVISRFSINKSPESFNDVVRVGRNETVFQLDIAGFF